MLRLSTTALGVTSRKNQLRLLGRAQCEQAPEGDEEEGESFLVHAEDVSADDCSGLFENKISPRSLEDTKKRELPPGAVRFIVVGGKQWQSKIVPRLISR